MNFKVIPSLLEGVSNFTELEKKIEELDTTKKKGDAFEEFTYFFLKYHASYYDVVEAYSAADIPTKYKTRLNITKPDAGMDGIWITSDDKIIAYQVKFRTNQEKPPYHEIAKLWADAARADLTYLFANCSDVTELAGKRGNHKNVLINAFDGLEEVFFRDFRTFISTSKVVVTKKSPRPHQAKIIEDVARGFAENQRGKVIAACGTGKTLTTLWIKENLKTKNVLYLVPSLALVKQTLNEWATQATDKFHYLCICSDKTVVENMSRTVGEEEVYTEELGDFSVADLDFPVTTDSKEIQKFIKNTSRDSAVVFCTYQSAKVLVDSLKGAKFFDLIIFDEAHRTAGVKNTELFNLCLKDENIPAKKRLFLTATEKLIKPRLKKALQSKDLELFSMDDHEVYGPQFSALNFGDAIQQKIICDYEILISSVQEKEVFEFLKSQKRLFSENLSDNDITIKAQSAFKQMLLLKALMAGECKKIITYHSSVNAAQAFINGAAGDYGFASYLKNFPEHFRDKTVYLDHINGSMSAAKRAEIFRDFASADIGILSNAQCLTEGVDLPEVDCVYFVDSRHSMIDIIQATGRAMRRDDRNPGKVAKILLPIMINDEVSEAEFLNNFDFSLIHNVIQSMRDQDTRLAEWVNELNLAVAQTKTICIGGNKGGKALPPQVRFFTAHEFNIDFLINEIAVRVATVNADPERLRYLEAKQYGKFERKSTLTRVLKTFGDYNVTSYQNLIDKTLELIKKPDAGYETDKIKFNNNNVSHTERLGLIKKGDDKKYYLTLLGKKYKDGKIKFEKLFSNQILKYYFVAPNGKLLFPYVSALLILAEVKSLRFIDFVFGIYVLPDSSEESINDAVERILYIKKAFPMIETLNETNKEAVLKNLNSLFHTEFSSTDIWAKKTTVMNQFGYFKNHLSLFEKIIEVKEGKIALKRDDKAAIKKLLTLNNPYFTQAHVDKDELDKWYKS